MPIASKMQTATALVLLTVASIGSARATIPVNYGTTELGQIRSNCFSVCFGPSCTASGTVDSIAVDAPFVVRGLRIASTGSGNPCNPVKTLTPLNLTLPRAVGAGQALVFDIDIVPVDEGAILRPVLINEQPSFLLEAQVNPVFDCNPGSSAMCLGDDRFKVRFQWRAFNGERGAGSTVPGNTPDSGLFYFFNQDNWEALVKVLNACSFNDRFWIFSAATTNVEYTLTVTDTQSQAVKSYFNPLGSPAPAVTDTDAFATCR